MSNASSTTVLVEDDDDLREMAVAMIADLGHRVLFASEGDETLPLT